MKDADIGGARVKRPFSRGGETLMAGAQLTRHDVLKIPIANRSALIDGGFLDVYPQIPGVDFIIQTGRGEYDVIRGVRINSGPLSKTEAEELAHRSNE